jgi:redox-sensing transcriptional repressor
MPLEIPEVVVARLPVYARALASLRKQGRDLVSSQELGEKLGVTPAQIRKDLSYFGRFGKQGRGYNVRRLLDELRQILGLEREWTMALVGVGHLGLAILTYGGFAPEGFRIVEAFDSDPSVIGQKVGKVTVKDVRELEATLGKSSVDIGIVAVPADSAQQVIDSVVKCGVKAILNYAPMSPLVPGEVRVQRVDPVLALQSMTFYLKSQPVPAKTKVS